MTELRDQFAMAALTGLMRFTDATRTDHHVFAEAAYRFADAMLEARAPAREPMVDDLDLSVRAANFLQEKGIRTIEALKKFNAAGLRDLGCTAKTAKEIMKTLWEHGDKAARP